MKDRTSDIARLRAELRDAEAAQSEFESAPAHVRVAEMLHDILCRHNHTDGCAWYYEEWNKPRGRSSTKARYADVSERLLANFTENQVRAFLAAVRGL